MERKLSAKATKMRRRLTFSRSNSDRNEDRSLTMVSPIETSRPGSRPRSASNPESPNHDEPTWDSSNPNSSRGYSFTDEPGYFRPTSPFIDRQEVEEDLEADIKHACALLSHSIDRGVPAGLSYQSAVPDWTNGNKVAGQPSANVAPSSLDQHILLLSAPKPMDPETDSTKKHDSGVSMSLTSPGQPGRPYGNSVPGTDTSRLYNKQSSASPPHSPSALRSRGQSLAATIEEDQPWERSYTSSLIPFPYSPPTHHSKWTTDPLLDSPASPVSPLNETDKRLEAVPSNRRSSQKSKPNNKPDPSPMSPSIPSLGEAGRTWLRASKDVQRLADEEKAKTKPKPKPSGRFYSSNNRIASAFDSREWLAKNFWEDRDPSLYGDVSSLSAAMGNGSRTGSSSRHGPGTPRLRSLSNNEYLPGEYPYRLWARSGPGRGVSCSSLGLRDEFKHQENVYSVVVPSEPVKSRRKKASVLFRRLAGFGRWREEKKGDGDGDVVC
jgi:hypothetical protein